MCCDDQFLKRKGKIDANNRKHLHEKFDAWMILQGNISIAYQEMCS